MSTCVTCSHSQRDHALGRCVNTRMAFVAAAGGTVATRCECKRYAVTDAPEAVAVSSAGVPVESSESSPVAEATEPRRRGRKPLPRDAEGNIIREAGDTSADDDDEDNDEA